MRWGIPVVGTALALVDKLTAWWGIVIIALIAGLHFMDAFTGVDRVARVVHDEPNVYEFFGFLVITLPMVAGLFVGNAIADTLGAAIGSVGAGLIGSGVWSVYVTRTERKFEERAREEERELQDT